MNVPLEQIVPCSRMVMLRACLPRVALARQAGHAMMRSNAYYLWRAGVAEQRARGGDLRSYRATNMSSLRAFKRLTEEI
ncbi:MAG TPA: hypothetical protein VIH22_00050 [Cyclobacteriaceae bacterium]